MLFTESSRETRKEVRFKSVTLTSIEMVQVVGNVRFREGSVNLEVALIPWGQFFLSHIGLPDTFRQFSNLFNAAKLLHITQEAIETRDAHLQNMLFHGSSSDPSSKCKRGGPGLLPNSVHEIAD